MTSDSESTSESDSTPQLEAITLTVSQLSALEARFNQITEALNTLQQQGLGLTSPHQIHRYLVQMLEAVDDLDSLEVPFDEGQKKLKELVKTTRGNMDVTRKSLRLWYATVATFLPPSMSFQITHPAHRRHHIQLALQ